jgi:surface carbohydrate biosynthesis protein (TIGR04326 family)
LAGGIFYFFAAVMAKRHERARGVDFDNAEQSPYLIHTFFPKMWTDRFGSWKDMYYGTLPQLLKDETDTEPVYALRAYDSTAFVPPAVYKDRLKLLDTPGKTPGRYMLLESFASSGEIVRAYLSPGDAINYFRMTLHPEFDRTFIWEGLDASELFKDRLWRSALVYWPNLQVLEQSVKRLTERLRPEVVASYCFEFIFGRAIISGTREGAPTAKVTGLQHGPVSPMKMLYSGVESERMCLTSSADALTEPDVYSVDGAIAARILENRGIPPSMIKTPGAARFDDVWDEIRRSRGTSKPREKLRVLVAPGLHDTPFLLGAALKALSNDNRLELVLKPHPKVPSDYVSRLVDSYTNSRQGDGAEVTLVKTGSIYEWMAESDIFLATYSSVGVEAIAFGLPVIMMLPNSTPDMSLYHSHHVPVLKASSADELREHVNKLASNPDFVSEYVSQLTDVLHDSFGPTDSQASQRLAKLCADIRNSHNATEGVEIPSNKIPTVAG